MKANDIVSFLITQLTYTIFSGKSMIRMVFTQQVVKTVASVSG